MEEDLVAFQLHEGISQEYGKGHEMEPILGVSKLDAHLRTF